MPPPTAAGSAECETAPDPSGGKRGRPLTLGRTFLVWLCGVLVLTFITVSALVLWHEERVLLAELEGQADLLARLLALSAGDGGSPGYLAIFSLTDLEAGEVRSTAGEVLWRYGPPFHEVLALDDALLRIDRRIEAASGPWGRDGIVEVSLLMSRNRVRNTLAGAAVRLAIALAFTLAVAMTVGLWIIGRIVEPINELAELTRSFDPRRPIEMSGVRAGPAEIVELAAAYREMARRLGEQQRSLAASERRYRDLFSSSPTPLLELDCELGVRAANAAAVAFLGVDPEDAAGLRLPGFLVDGLDPAEVRARSGSNDERDEGVVEARWRLPDGDLAEVELHLRGVGDGGGDGYLVAIHDLTDRVRRLGERWRRTFDAMIDGVAVIGPDGVVELANRALAPHLAVASRELQQRGTDAGSWRTSDRDRVLECNLSRPETSSRAILVVRDVTEAVRAEARLREVEKMQAVGTLASGVAHDFNNILAAVQLHLRLIESEPERTPEAVAAIAELTRQGSEVVGELLLFARSDDSIEPQTFDLAALVTDQTTVLNHLLPDGVTLEIRTDGGPVPVTGNPVAIRRLILNLVVNARDAVAAAGGSIEVTVARRAGRAVLEVADTGPGVPAEIRDRLFEPFFTLRRKGRGAGLGLAVVYAVATAHGGEVELVSGPGEGARFVVRLPPGDPDDLTEDAGDAGNGARRRVVLVEPSGRTAATLMEHLAAQGCEIRHAPDVAAANRIVESWRPAAVLAAADDRETAAWAAAVGVPLVVTDRVAEILSALDAI